MLQWERQAAGRWSGLLEGQHQHHPVGSTARKPGSGSTGKHAIAGLWPCTVAASSRKRKRQKLAGISKSGGCFWPWEGHTLLGVDLGNTATSLPQMGKHRPEGLRGYASETKGIIHPSPASEGFSPGYHFHLALEEPSRLMFCKCFATFHFPQETTGNPKSS